MMSKRRSASRLELVSCSYTRGVAEGGLIVVGVDDSVGARAAARWAAAEAKIRRATLEVLHVWTMPLAVGLPETGVLGRAVLHEPAFDEEHDRYEREAMSVLESAVEGIDAIEFEPKLVEHANAARALIDAAENADLLVLGSRTEGGLRARFTGSTAGECLRLGRCPVVIVPPPEEEG